MGGSSSAPIVHIVNKRPDQNRGVLKLARYIGSSAVRSANATFTTVNYEELCTLPCGVAVDISERPMLFFFRDGASVSHGFRLPSGATEITLKVAPTRSAMRSSGVILTGLLLLPIGIPLMIVAKSRVWAGNGPPSEAQKFVRLKKARR